uniref:SKP1 component dimerisation domain-containing protein n=1 Tax=Panagrolaimus sp. PS1159 TaxID=55785 RepID=A0AC35FD66_9BILA
MESTSTPKITLRASLDLNKLEIPIGENIIKASTFLTNLTETCTDDTTLDVNMTSKQLEQFTTFFNHYPSTTAPKDTEFETEFFQGLTDEEFFSLCKAIDFFDCDRFTEAAADFVVTEKIPEMKTEDLRSYLGIKNDIQDKNLELFEASTLEYYKQ